MKKKSHKYSPAEKKWLKNCVLPVFADREALTKWAEKFNKEFETDISEPALYNRAMVYRGKWQSQSKKKRKKRKQHKYTSQQEIWLQDQDISNIKGAKKIKKFGVSFNRFFGTSINPKAVHLKALRLKGIRKLQGISTKKSKGNLRGGVKNENRNVEYEVWVGQRKIYRGSKKPVVKKITRKMDVEIIS